jgi:hypothetical protein
LAATNGPEHCFSVSTQGENRVPIVREARNIAKIVWNIVLAIFSMFLEPETMRKRLSHCDEGPLGWENLSQAQKTLRPR